MTGKSLSSVREPDTVEGSDPRAVWRREEGLDWFTAAIPEENYQANHVQIVTGYIDGRSSMMKNHWRLQLQ